MGRAMALVRTLSFGFKEADGDVFKEDQWVRFNDGKVTHVYLVDELVGGRADTQIAYIVIYKKDKVPDGSIEEIVDEEMEMESNPEKKGQKVNSCVIPIY
ncbi:hypothetical protein Pmar_PMAR006405 [Perkinsus marinus ATCC 50983]|uniref:Uncharacterized protein n=1 Tax=Perkinsus marinus (strain ATCC 50983 / TXsc) TaxID=423536 RepID=C5K9L3_PERM5|nr:hypothetical protein Pmar_PMAR006405 [Perkinsus marinus ATCC 50983]EER18785.1 hypothetical protein Pmar_PMAR006405 [Perkinsus marinus ATCC 50983]|eukprot:XP_002786989.1 hypothetical protein Pmar_PMAR006405 [Perkinsus marinus ATCC 50983]